jgi:hypothetical protein
VRTTGSVSRAGVLGELPGLGGRRVALGAHDVPGVVAQHVGPAREVGRPRVELGVGAPRQPVAEAQAERRAGVLLLAPRGHGEGAHRRLAELDVADRVDDPGQAAGHDRVAEQRRQDLLGRAPVQRRARPPHTHGGRDLGRPRQPDHVVGVEVREDEVELVGAAEQLRLGNEAAQARARVDDQHRPVLAAQQQARGLAGLRREVAATAEDAGGGEHRVTRRAA